MTDAPRIVKLKLSALVPHPLNANRMTDESISKLMAHIDQHDNYPPLIVRPCKAEVTKYEIIDGANRATALKLLGRDHAWCQVWDVTDTETLVLLQTLNRLEGTDDPYLKGTLLKQLAREFEITQLAELLPLEAAKIRKFIAATETPPKPQAPETSQTQVHALTIFCTIPQRREILAGLKPLDKDLALAVLKALQMAASYQDQMNVKRSQ